jgi:hypothetical protein
MSALTANQQLVVEELADLAAALGDDALLREDLSPEDQARRQIQRLLTSTRRLLVEHQLDERGTCSACGRRLQRRRNCPVAGILAEYAQAWTAFDRASALPPSARHATRTPRHEGLL